MDGIYNFLQWSFLGEVKNDVTGVKNQNSGTRKQESFWSIAFELAKLEQN